MGLETTTEPISIKGFRGLNTKYNEIGIGRREASAIKNVNLNLKRFTTKNGSALFTTTQAVEAGTKKPVTGIYQAVLAGTTYRVMTAGTKVYSVTSAGVKSDITGAATIDDSQDKHFRFASFVDGSNNDIMILANKYNPTLKWNGAGNVSALSGTPGNLNLLLVSKNRLWATVDDFLYHTEFLDGETWDALFFADRFKTPGFNLSEITGLAEFGQSIFVAKEDAIFLLSGESIPVGYSDKILTGDGVAGGSSVVEIPNTRYGNILAFYNKNHELVGFDGTKNLIPLGDHIKPTLRNCNKVRAKYVSAVRYEELNQYVSTVTSTPGGGANDKLVIHDYFMDGQDQQDAERESSMMIHDGLALNVLGLMDFQGVTSLFGGTYDGWIVRLDTGSTDVPLAAQIEAAPTGCVRASNVVTITTLDDHEFAVGDTVVVSGSSGGFDGTFEVATTPTGTTFTYAQTGSDTTGGAGVAYVQAEIESYWQSRKEDFGSSAHLKQVNDLNVVCSNPAAGSIQVDINTVESRASAETEIELASGATIYGPPSIYGEVIYGGTGLSYTRIVAETANGDRGIASRYLQFRISGVDGFRMGIDELVIGITDNGYQPQLLI